MKVRKQLISEIAAALAFVLLLGLFSFAAGDILRPERADYGALWDKFGCEADNSIDILFTGSSLVYCGIIPATVYGETGLSSYVMASPVQPIPLSYYYIKEAFRSQSPEFVCVDVTQVYINDIDNYTQIGIDYMPYSGNRIGAMFALADGELLGQLLFPLSVYHSRWREADLGSLFKKAQPDILAGYTLLLGSGHAENDLRTPTDDGDTIDRNYRYLEKIAALCRENGAKAVFYITPSCLELPEDRRTCLRDFSLGLDGVTFSDFSDCRELCGLGDDDFFDKSHLNFRGAMKFSAFFSDFLIDCGAVPGEMNDEVKDIWQSRMRYIENIDASGVD